MADNQEFEVAPRMEFESPARRQIRELGRTRCNVMRLRVAPAACSAEPAGHSVIVSDGCQLFGGSSSTPTPTPDPPRRVELFAEHGSL